MFYAGFPVFAIFQDELEAENRSDLSFDSKSRK